MFVLRDDQYRGAGQQYTRVQDQDPGHKLQSLSLPQLQSANEQPKGRDSISLLRPGIPVPVADSEFSSDTGSYVRFVGVAAQVFVQVVVQSTFSRHRPGQKKSCYHGDHIYPPEQIVFERPGMAALLSLTAFHITAPGYRTRRAGAPFAASGKRRDGPRVGRSDERSEERSRQPGVMRSAHSFRSTS